MEDFNGKLELQKASMEEGSRSGSHPKEEEEPEILCLHLSFFSF